MLFVRSTLFNIFFFTITPIYSLLLIISRVMGFSASWFWARQWSHTVLWFAKIFCGIYVKVEGKEHLTDTPCVVMAKHQSALETIAMPLLIPPYVWVLKKELLHIPIFGWALRVVDAIAVDFSNPRQALKSVNSQGEQFLHDGRWVVIFPEGTRAAVGHPEKYKGGGIMLAKKSGVGILPLAHNTGCCWGKRSYIKTPGTVRLRFLPMISAAEVASRPRKELLQQLEHDIESHTRELGG
ncbi:MAG: lysophospholipid acyltransferase family protein [Mariprofundaceae bacterium]|nr:lysophospholipid acyltransferase family protein [Mariprofundaceae bacterium]